MKPKRSEGGGEGLYLRVPERRCSLEIITALVLEAERGHWVGKRSACVNGGSGFCVSLLTRRRLPRAAPPTCSRLRSLSSSPPPH